MRRVVRRDHGNHAIEQCLPKRLVVLFRFDGWIHFYQRTEPLIIVNIKKQMMRANFGRDQLAPGINQLNFLRRRHVQHVKAVIVAMRQVDCSSCGNDGSFVVADTRVISDIGATPENIEELKRASRTPGIKIFIGSSTGDLLVDEQAALERIFAGTSLPELKKSIESDAPDLNHLTLPAGITEVIIKALQKKPYMRFADAQQMLTSVEYCEAQLRERMNQHT